MAKAEHDSITRRTLLSGAAATVPAVALPSVVIAAPAAMPAALPAAITAPDLIFVAIEAHVRAYDEFIAVLDEMAIVERAAWNAPRGQRRAANKKYAAARTAERRFGNLEGDAMDRLVETVPQTLQGAVGVLRYIRERFERRHSLEEETLMALLGSIEQAICRTLGEAA
jgi:regulator of protease activity HflC (stomatin/prohibitin superfamily)